MKEHSLLINIPRYWMNHIVQIVVFGLFCYFRSIFVSRSCSLKSLLCIFYKFNVIVYRQSDCRDIKFSTSYSRFSISCLRCIRNLSRRISILINSQCRCSINLSNYTILHHNKSSSISRLTWVDLEISKNY